MKTIMFKIMEKYKLFTISIIFDKAELAKLKIL